MRKSYENHPTEEVGQYQFTPEITQTYNIKSRTVTQQANKKTQHDIIKNVLLSYEEIVDTNIPYSKVKKISYKDLTIMIEEYYTKVYQKLQEKLQENKTEQNEGEELCVSTILRNFMNEKFDQREDLINLMIASIVFSCHVHSETYCDAELFLRFLTKEFNEKELKFFIFVRAIIEKELKRKFFDINNRIDTRGTLMDIDQIYAILNAIFGFGKSVRQANFLKQLDSFDENYRFKKKVSVYKFLYVALYDFFTYERYKGRDNIANEVGSQYLDIGCKKKYLNPKMYQQGVSNIISKNENHIKKCERSENKVTLNDLNPRKSIYEDFAELYENDDYRACYANGSSAKKKYKELVWMKENKKRKNKVQPMIESVEQYSDINKVDEFISGERFDPKYALQDEIDKENLAPDQIDYESKNQEIGSKKQIPNQKSNRIIFDNISLDGTPTKEKSYDGPSITLTDKVQFYEFDSFEKALVDNVSRNLKSMIGAMISYNLQESRDFLTSDIDHKRLIYDIIWPKVSKIVEAIYGKDQKQYCEQLGLEKSSDCKSFENLKIMCEQLKSDFESNKTDQESDIGVQAKHIFQIDILATEIIRQITIMSGNAQFTN